MAALLSQALTNTSYMLYLKPHLYSQIHFFLTPRHSFLAAQSVKLPLNLPAAFYFAPPTTFALLSGPFCCVHPRTPGTPLENDACFLFYHYSRHTTKGSLSIFSFAFGCHTTAIAHFLSESLALSPFCPPAIHLNRVRGTWLLVFRCES